MSQPGCYRLLCLALGLLLAACTVPAQPASQPLDRVQTWGKTVRSYRYERTTLATQPDGKTTVINETGDVVLPDRQHLTIRGDAKQDEAGSEIIIIGKQAWARPLGFGLVWEAAQAGQVPTDPLSVALGSIEAAEVVSNVGERTMEDGRRCQGWSYRFEPQRVPGWPAAASAHGVTAEAVLWSEPGGMICSQTVRVTRPDQPASEYTMVLRDFGVPLIIEAPVG